MSESFSDSYAAAGVDVTAGYKAVELMKKHVERTQTPEVMSSIGGFGGMVLPDLTGIAEPVLVSGRDGVGTKLKIAFLADKHDTVGIDCVAMCVNDIACCGARPMFFLDYIACGKNKPERIAEIVSGVAEGCVRGACALVGGETAEMPGFYAEDEYDIAGFAVGIIDRKRMIDGSRIKDGDIIIGLASTGVHSNGFSLVRKLLDVENADLKEYQPELGCSLGDELLKPTRIYCRTVTTLVDKNGKPILKPVSAYDIDKYFEMLVDMYKEDAVLMNMVDYKTRKVQNLKMDNRMDLSADDVIRLADKCLKYDDDMASLTSAVRSQLRVELNLADWELNNAIRDALEEVKNLRQVNADDTQNRFARFVKNYVDGSYADQLTDEGRLANLIARRIENVKAFRQTLTANLDNKAAHCAQMLKLAYPDKIVDVKKAQEAIAATLRVMIERAYPEQPPAGEKRSSCKTNLDKLMVNGRLFTDELRYDISHRAPGRDEIDLKDNMKILLGCIEHYGKIDRATFMRKSGEGEVMA